MLIYDCPSRRQYDTKGEAMKPLGVAIIGYGFIGKVHAFAYRTLPFFYSPPPAGVRLVGVCTSRAETAEAARQHGDFETSTADASELIGRDDVDIVNICTPNHLHKDQLLAAMTAGKHIYCDKPLTGTWEDAQIVARALDGYGGIGQMTFNNRFCVPAMHANQLIQDGFVGKVTQFRAVYLHSGSVSPDKPMGWKQEATAGGGVINDLGSHIVDLVDWLVGPIVEVSAETRILHPERLNRRGERVAVEAEDCVGIMARLHDGGVGVIEASKIATGAEDELRVEIHGDRGALRFNTMQGNYLEVYSLADPEAPLGGQRGWKRIDTVHRYQRPAGWPGPKFPPGWIRGHVHCLYNFVSAVAEGRQAEPSLRRGVRVQYMLERIRQSAQQRAWLALSQEG